MGHLVLLGDSIFDNRAYVGGGPAVIDQLQQALPAGWRATLAAVDGGTTSSVPGQLARLPADATHLVVSAGGNDALFQINVLQQQVRTVGEALDRLADLHEQFEQSYTHMLGQVLGAGLWTAVCTIYNPAFADPLLQRMTTIGLMLFNDCILRLAGSHRLPVLDLRRVCTTQADYANPIEPSIEGGAKIVQSLLSMLFPAGEQRRSLIYP